MRALLSRLPEKIFQILIVFQIDLRLFEVDNLLFSNLARYSVFEGDDDIPMKVVMNQLFQIRHKVGKRTIIEF